ncbi:MAG: hypothetical protein KKC03_10115 [Bacteroidetes bacterium]|nr:hypothetical protein [Bacteroidota bacterium]
MKTYRRDQIELYFGEEMVISYKVISLTNNRIIVETSTDFDENGSLDTVLIIAFRNDPYGWFS